MMFVIRILACLLIFTSFQPIFGAGLCKSKDWWYDIQFGKCRLCKECTGKSLKVEDCTQFMDTLCADLVEIERSIDRNIEKGRKANAEVRVKPDDATQKQLKEAFMQAMKARLEFTEYMKSFDPNFQSRTVVASATSHSVSKHSLGDFVHSWERTLVIVLCITLITVIISVIILMQRYAGRLYDRCSNRKNNRGRLFSRDRLNTTEYMHNLATIDRGLAMDEILEKRKKAIFEPQILSENVYSDEVFIDVPGIPRTLNDEHEYEELDYRKCLLQIREH